MGSKVWYSTSWRAIQQTSMATVVLIVSGLYLRPIPAVNAVPVVDTIADSTLAVPPIPLSPIPSTPFPSSPFRTASFHQALGLATPTLPPLGEADLFLPDPDEKLIRLVISLSDRRVYIYEQDQIVKSYPIAIGRNGWETPTGKFEVIQMFQNPVWEHPFTGELVPPGPDNPLGSRWIGFWTDGTNYIGFHGTPNAETVGQAASHGCIRMYDQDVVALFEIVQVGTPVEVMP